MSRDAEADLASLGADIWEWRAGQQPCGYDDLQRLPRPPGWYPDFSPDAVGGHRRTEAELRGRWEAIDTGGLSVAAAVDHRLLGSALARVRWELDVVQGWRRDPTFHVHQALDPYYLLLLPAAPFDRKRSDAVVAALARAPQAFTTATDSLTDPASPQAGAAIGMLDGIVDRLTASARALTPHLSGPAASRVVGAATEAGHAAEEFRRWLEVRLPQMSPHTAVGRAALVWFLRNVALVSETPEQLIAMARQERHRAAGWEAVRSNRARLHPERPVAVDGAAQSAAQVEAEAEVRAFYETSGLLTQHDDHPRYLTRLVPDHLAPITFLGVADDLTDEHRMDQDAVAYFPSPGPDLPYFYAANARDPRAGIVHEGAHYQQFSRSYRHPDPVRHRYYDSGPSEGLAFYNEELMLQAGLFDDAPHTAAVIYNFAKLRAIRVEVDIKLATGEFSLDEAIDFFVRTVPMDRHTAAEETTFYVGSPGQAHSYQTGRLHLMALLSAAIEDGGDGFSLRDFHDEVWRNGNVPFSLQRWEMLGRRDEIDAIEADPQYGAEPPVPDHAQPG